MVQNQWPQTAFWSGGGGEGGEGGGGGRGGAECKCVMNLCQLFLIPLYLYTIHYIHLFKYTSKGEGAECKCVMNLCQLFLIPLYLCTIHYIHLFKYTSKGEGAECKCVMNLCNYFWYHSIYILYIIYICSNTLQKLSMSSYAYRNRQDTVMLLENVDRNITLNQQQWERKSDFTHKWCNPKGFATVCKYFLCLIGHKQYLNIQISFSTRICAASRMRLTAMIANKIRIGHLFATLFCQCLGLVTVWWVACLLWSMFWQTSQALVLWDFTAILRIFSLSLVSGTNPFTPTFNKYILPTVQRETYKSEIMRIGAIIIFHLSKLHVWKAKFFMLCDVIFLMRLQGKFKIDHTWGENCFSISTSQQSWSKLLEQPLNMIYIPHTMLIVWAQLGHWKWGEGPATWNANLVPVDCWKLWLKLLYSSLPSLPDLLLCVPEHLLGHRVVRWLGQQKMAERLLCVCKSPVCFCNGKCSWSKLTSKAWNSHFT